MTTREPVPFEELLAPLVTDAAARLRSLSGPALALFAASAIGDLEYNLLRLLSGLAAQPLQLHWRASGANYRDYTRAHGRLRELLADYSALGSLLQLAVGTWTRANVRLMKRLDRDRRRLGFVDRVVGVRPALSDRRKGGHTVAILEVEDGRRLVYKPRSVGADRAFAAILEWCNAAAAADTFHVPAVTVRRTYGWQEFVPHLPCDTEEGVRRYFERAGSLLCVLYVLHATDCHMGNVIASGEYPVVVDAETLFQSLPQPSVLATGLLPELEAEYNIGGLGVGHSPATEFRVPSWRYINTDAMTLGYRRAAIRPHLNLPVLGSETVNPKPYLNEVVAGFETMYRVLATRRRGFLRIVSGEWNQSVRRMLHQTRDYFTVLNESLQPRFLRDRKQRANQIGRALQSFGMNAADSDSLLALDIPHAYADPDKRGVRATILGMSEADLARQRSLIRVAWISAVLGRRQAAAAGR